MLLAQSRKEKHHDNLCEELLRERAAVLSRAGIAVEDALDELTQLSQEIQIKNNQLRSLFLPDRDTDNIQRKRLILEEINVCINQFNLVREKAMLKYYYLIVTREALGLRRHDTIQEIYAIPAKKKMLQVN